MSTRRRKKQPDFHSDCAQWDKNLSDEDREVLSRFHNEKMLTYYVHRDRRQFKLYIYAFRGRKYLSFKSASELVRYAERWEANEANLVNEIDKMRLLFKMHGVKHTIHRVPESDLDPFALIEPGKFFWSGRGTRQTFRTLEDLIHTCHGHIQTSTLSQS